MSESSDTWTPETINLLVEAIRSELTEAMNESRGVQLDVRRDYDKPTNVDSDRCRPSGGFSVVLQITPRPLENGWMRTDKYLNRIGERST